MNQEVKHFQRVNLNLGLIVEDLSMRQEGLQQELDSIITVLERLGEALKSGHYFQQAQRHINTRILSQSPKMFL